MEQGLASGQMAYDYSDPNTGEQKAVFDLAWQEGLQPGLTEPVAVLLNESPEVLVLASAAGFRCFTTVTEFRTYVEAEYSETRSGLANTVALAKTVWLHTFSTGCAPCRSAHDVADRYAERVPGKQ